MKIRKRTFLPIIFTVLALVISNKYWLVFKTKTSAHFEFEIFFIIAFVSFLLIYKLSDYVADFKTIREKSRIDIIFLVIFFIFLFVPMSRIDNNEISKQENRTLATWQPLIKPNNKINFRFGKDFNEWFNDRFNLRITFINSKNFLTMLIADRCDRGFFDKKNRIIYPNWSFKHRKISVVKNNFKALYQLNDFCNKNNIKLYILVVPNKADIYEYKYSSRIVSEKQEQKFHSQFANYIDSINRENKLKIIYPYKKMKEESDNKMLYFKTEHHWTDDGAYIGYLELMKEIKKDYPDVKILSDKDFNYFTDKGVRSGFTRGFANGQDCWRLGISDKVCKKYHKYDYRYYKHKNFDDLKTEVINIPFHKEKIYEYPYGANYRVIQLGTSQNENLTEFIPFTFKHVKRLRNNNVKEIKTEEEFKIMKYYEKEIVDYRPNILIFCITYNNIKNLRNLFNME